MLLVRPGREVRRCSDQWWSAGRAVGDRCARVGGSLQKSCADRGACGGQRPSAESSLLRLASSAGGIRGKRARGNRAPAAIGEWWTDIGARASVSGREEATGWGALSATRFA
jgi:hypothetical protein